MPTSLNDYEVVATIGSGSYGTCKKIRRKKDGRILVWKEMDYGTMSETEKQMLVSEVNLLRELKHQYIVRYYDRIIDRANTRLYIIMEYCEGGDLASCTARMKKEGRTIEESFAWKICTQIILALKECHSREKNGKTVLHRDLKPANVFLDANNNVKLGDFGLARVLNHDTSFAKTFVGTPYYMSPEQMNYMSYNAKSDIWSLGCLLYELCANRPPFTAPNQRELATKICVGRFTRIPYRFSDDLNTFIACMIRVDEHKRPTIEDLLEHPIIKHHLPRQPPQPASVDTPEARSTPTSSRVQTCTPDAGAVATGGSDEGYASKVETLKKQVAELEEKEERLRELERRLGHREKELDEREKHVILREKVADEKLSRADRLVREYKTIKTTCSCGANLKVKASALSEVDTNLKNETSGIKELHHLKGSPNLPGTAHLVTPPSNRQRIPTPPIHKQNRVPRGACLGKENFQRKPPTPPSSNGRDVVNRKTPQPHTPPSSKVNMFAKENSNGRPPYPPTPPPTKSISPPFQNRRLRGNGMDSGGKKKSEVRKRHYSGQGCGSRKVLGELNGDVITNSPKSLPMYLGEKRDKGLANTPEKNM